MNSLILSIAIIAAIPWIAYAIIKHCILAYCEYLNLKRCRKLPPNVYGVVKLFLTAKP